MLLHDTAHLGHAHAARVSDELARWLVMVVAMMLPLQMDQASMVALRGFRARRGRAVAGFVVGYLLPWVILGLPVAWLTALPWSREPVLGLLAFGVAAAWVPTRMRAHALAACHRRPAPAPSGWRAHRDCIVFGAGIGVGCVGSCWALMLACALSGHRLPIMLGGAAVALAERRFFEPPTRLVGIATVALAASYGVWIR